MAFGKVLKAAATSLYTLHIINIFPLFLNVKVQKDEFLFEKHSTSKYSFKQVSDKVFDIE
ncbi:hypothetical protein EON65_31435 [archaeon]|nr:MAG: hypothetical protein EON65_31435 [archaeon]